MTLVAARLSINRQSQQAGMHRAGAAPPAAAGLTRSDTAQSLPRILSHWSGRRKWYYRTAIMMAGGWPDGENRAAARHLQQSLTSDGPVPRRSNKHVQLKVNSSAFEAGATRREERRSSPLTAQPRTKFMPNFVA